MSILDEMGNLEAAVMNPTATTVASLTTQMMPLLAGAGGDGSFFSLEDHVPAEVRVAGYVERCPSHFPN